MERVLTERHDPALLRILDEAFKHGRHRNHEVIKHVVYLVRNYSQSADTRDHRIGQRARRVLFRNFLRRNAHRPPQASSSWHATWLESVANEDAHAEYGAGNCGTLYSSICHLLVHLSNTAQLQRDERQIVGDFVIDSLHHGCRERTKPDLSTTRFASMVNGCMPGLCHLAFDTGHPSIIWRSVNDDYDVLGKTRRTAIRRALTELICGHADVERAMPQIVEAYRNPESTSRIAAQAAEALVPQLIRTDKLILQPVTRSE